MKLSYVVYLGIASVTLSNDDADILWLNVILLFHVVSQREIPDCALARKIYSFNLHLNNSILNCDISYNSNYV